MPACPHRMEESKGSVLYHRHRRFLTTRVTPVLKEAGVRRTPNFLIEVFQNATFCS